MAGAISRELQDSTRKFSLEDTRRAPTRYIMPIGSKFTSTGSFPCGPTMNTTSKIASLVTSFSQLRNYVIHELRPGFCGIILRISSVLVVIKVFQLLGFLYRHTLSSPVSR